MRRPTVLTRTLITASAALSAAGLVGCAAGPAGSRQPALYGERGAPDREDPRRDMQQQASDQRVSPEELDRLFALVRTLEKDNNQLKQKVSDQYMQVLAMQREQVEANKAAINAAANGQANPARPAANTAGADAANAPKPALDLLSRKQLVDALIKRIEASADPVRTKALMAAAISVAGDRGALDPRLLEPLDPRSREQVARFHQMLAVAYEELAGQGEGAKKELTRGEMMAKLDEVFGAQPLSIEALELCKRVDSYGAYESFGATRFLAGRRNRVLVYVELDNFHHQPVNDEKFEVRVEQTIELYDATGEATVWRAGPDELVDVSRNKRRDFFIVYPIELPVRLGVGKYRLKVRIADKHTGSICEQTLHDIHIVADKAMVERGK